MKGFSIMTHPLAIITGGAQGIGRATVELLLDEGWRVAALEKLGRRPLSVDATSVNWETSSNPPSICCRLQFMRPSPSANTR